MITKETLENLLEKYTYEFSQYTQARVEKDGLFYYCVDDIFNDKNCYSYFIKVDGELAGFALINNFLEINIPTDKIMYEFFITYPFRRKGIGRQATYQIFKQFCGSWQLE